MHKFLMKYLPTCGVALGLFMSSNASAQSLVSEAPMCRGRVSLRKSCANGLCSKGASIVSHGGWHGLGLCIRDLRDLLSRKGPQSVALVGGKYKVRADQLALNAMLSGIMEAKIGRWSDREKRYLPLANGDRISAEDKVAILNSKRRAFNGMSQTELAASLDGLARVSARDGAGARKATEFYKAVSQAALNVVITPVDRGGLATFITCTDGERRCAWYHSVTSQGANVARRGALNQHLHVVRDLLRLANGNKYFGYLTDYASYGLNQLFIGPDGEQVSNIPTFATFLGPKGPQGRGALLAYGFDAKPNGLTTYFLSQAQKNCHYAIHDLELLAAILKQPTMARTIAAAKALSTGSAVFKADQALRAIDDTGNSGSSEFVCNPSFNYGKSATGRFFAKHF